MTYSVATMKLVGKLSALLTIKVPNNILYVMPYNNQLWFPKEPFSGWFFRDVKGLLKFKEPSHNVKFLERTIGNTL